MTLRVTLDAPFAAVERQTRTALAEQGFGVLTEIDVRATMREKLGEELDDYVILGACNPPLASRALGVDPTAGLLLPCNVVVRGTADGTVVEAVDPRVLVDVTGEPGLAPVAEEAGARLRAALASLVEQA